MEQRSGTEAGKGRAGKGEVTWAGKPLGLANQAQFVVTVLLLLSRKNIFRIHNRLG